METKICTRCKEEKSFNMFSKAKKGKFGLRATCKSCDSHYHFSNKEKISSKAHIYYENNKDIIITRTAQYRIDNPTYKRDYDKKYWQLNKEKSSILSKNWRKANLEKLRPIKAADASKRRSLKRQASPLWANLEKVKQIYVDCQLISEMTGIKHHVDHIIPLKGTLVSGLHVEYNLRIIPAIENLSKNNTFIESLL